ncbi:MaoC/PaaZ C-terminal domain-containing protein [Nesterenkonia suensis]
MSPQQFRRIGLPTLAQVYLRAGWGAARTTLGRRTPEGGPDGLPERGVVARHAGVTPEQAEAYRGLMAGEAFDGVHRRALPSVLVHIMGFPVQMGLLAGDDFPLPLMGMVHLSNEVDHRRPVRPETPVQIRAWAEGLRAHRRGTQFDAVVEVLTDGADVDQPEAEQILWRGTSTYLSRGVHLAGRPDPSTGEGRSGREEFTAPPKTGQWCLAADVGRRYAAVSGDWNPIHVSGLSARMLGMPRAIVHGMYAAGRVLEGREPEQAGHRWHIRFEAPMRLPGTVALHVARADAVGAPVESFTGWDPRAGKRHFQGELHLPS